MDDHFLEYAPQRDIYRLLQVDPRADTATIVGACRRLARFYHPDYNPSPRATEEMRVVNTVRRVMTDPLARARYDYSRQRYLATAAAIRWPGAIPAAGPRYTAPRPYVPPTVAAPPPRPLLGLYSMRGVRDQLVTFARPARRIGVRARAMVVGIRAGIAALAPPRCDICREALGTADRMCFSCGTPRLRSYA